MNDRNLFGECGINGTFPFKSQPSERERRAILAKVLGAFLWQGSFCCAESSTILKLDNGRRKRSQLSEGKHICSARTPSLHSFLAFLHPTLPSSIYPSLLVSLTFLPSLSLFSPPFYSISRLLAPPSSLFSLHSSFLPPFSLLNHTKAPGPKVVLHSAHFSPSIQIHNRLFQRQGERDDSVQHRRANFSLVTPPPHSRFYIIGNWLYSQMC